MAPDKLASDLETKKRPKNDYQKISLMSYAIRDDQNPELFSLGVDQSVV